MHLALAGALLTNLAACGPPVDPVADQAVVRNVGAQAIQALNRGDVDTLASLLREDVVFIYQNGPTLVGRQQVREQLGPFATKVSLQLLRQDEQVVINGDWAFYRSALFGTMTPPTGPAEEIRTEVFDILKREPDDAWRYARMMGIPYWSPPSKQEPQEK